MALYPLFKLFKEIKIQDYFKKGDRAFKSEQYREAINYYNLALKNSSPQKEPKIYESIAFAHYNLENYTESLLYADTAIKYYVENNIGNNRITILKDLIETIYKKLNPSIDK